MPYKEGSEMTLSMEATVLMTFKDSLETTKFMEEKAMIQSLEMTLKRQPVG